MSPSQFVCLVIFLFSFLYNGVQKINAQSIYDFSSSQKYASYLIESSKFVEGAEEYERMLRQFPGNDSLRWFAGAAWYRAGKPEKALDLVAGIPPVTPSRAAMLLIWKLECGESLKTDSLQLIYNRFSPDFRSDAEILSRFSNAQIRRKYIFQDTFGTPDLRNLHKQLDAFKWKHPGKAAIMSALVPGLGKLYCKDYKDALFSFLYVSLSSFQVMRGLDKKNGQWATYSLIFAGVGGVFYLGNIYGAYQSAKRYNRNATREFRQQALKKFSGTWLTY